MRKKFMRVFFDQFDPSSEKEVQEGLRGPKELDYSPLPRITWRTFNTAVLVSMGGMM